VGSSSFSLLPLKRKGGGINSEEERRESEKEEKLANGSWGWFKEKKRNQRVQGLGDTRRWGTA